MLLAIAVTILTGKSFAQTCNPGFNFTFINGSTVKFNPAVTTDSPMVQHYWFFGDGFSSSQISPVHYYASAGIYSVKHYIQRNTTGGAFVCVDSLEKVLTIQQNGCNLQAAYTTATAPQNTLEVHFTNTTVNQAATDTIRWTFGDGTGSNVTNPTHIYTQSGTYTVCLKVIRATGDTSANAPCVSESCKTITVAAACNLTAGFNWYKDSTIAKTIRFQNTSIPLHNTDSIRWTFGDGSSSNLIHPTHTYAQQGTYTVCLRIQQRNANGTLTNCIKEICKTITIQEICSLQAKFSWRRDSVNNKKIYFTNLTVIPNANATALWSFGDGTTATSWNAIHEYAQPGWYKVCLEVRTSNTCYSFYCDSVRVETPAPGCIQLSNFHFEKTMNDPQRFIFTPNYISNDIQYSWTFGDGSGSHDVIANHRYAVAGTYTICLTAFKNNNCASTTCRTITVVASNGCDTATAGYWAQADPVHSNKFYFHAYSTVNIIDQVWTITKVGGTSVPPVILHQNNPSYIFSDTGFYYVCLKATLAGGCIKNYCQNIYVAQGANTCELQVYPNPATTIVKVNVTLTQPEIIRAYVYNSLNVLVLDKQQPGVTGTNVVELGVGNLVVGMYTIKLVYGNKVCFARFAKL